MHIVSYDSAVGQSSTPAPRHAIFSNAHKGLRRCLAETLVAVGCTDSEDAVGVATAVGAVREMLEACRLHLVAENKFIHPAMEARRPGSSRSTKHAHDDHEQSFEVIADQVAVVEGTSGRARRTALAVLYHQLALFAAENYEHMFEEESRNQAVLWDTYTDVELRAIEGAIVASHSPAQSFAALRWMLPSMTRSERVALLAGAKATMPREAFDGLLRFVMTVLGEAERAALQAALRGADETRAQPAA